MRQIQSDAAHILLARMINIITFLRNVIEVSNAIFIGNNGKIYENVSMCMNR